VAAIKKGEENCVIFILGTGQMKPSHFAFSRNVDVDELIFFADRRDGKDTIARRIEIAEGDERRFWRRVWIFHCGGRSKKEITFFGGVGREDKHAKKREEATGKDQTSVWIGATWPPFAAVGVNVCQRSLKRTSERKKKRRDQYVTERNAFLSRQRIHPKAFHHTCTAGILLRQSPPVSKEVKKQWPLWLTDGRLRLADLCKLDDATALGPRAVKQNLRKLDLARRLKEFDQILVRRGPRKL
jgi:hypothetical protein